MFVHLSRIALNNLRLTNNTTSQFGSNFELQNGGMTRYGLGLNVECL